MKLIYFCLTTTVFLFSSITFAQEFNEQENYELSLLNDFKNLPTPLQTSVQNTLDELKTIDLIVVDNLNSFRDSENSKSTLENQLMFVNGATRWNFGFDLQLFGYNVPVRRYSIQTSPHCVLHLKEAGTYPKMWNEFTSWQKPVLHLVQSSHQLTNQGRLNQIVFRGTLKLSGNVRQGFGYDWIPTDSQSVDVPGTQVQFHLKLTCSASDAIYITNDASLTSMQIMQALGSYLAK